MNKIQEDIVIYQAQQILERRLSTRLSNECTGAFVSPGEVKNFLMLHLADLEHEVFSCMFLDARNRLIAYETLFTGTLTQASVYPREVVKRALQHNAAGIIFAHNHPSGVAEVSKADEMLTQTLKQALSLVDVKVLDHIVAGHGEVKSMAEAGTI